MHWIFFFKLAMKEVGRLLILLFLIFPQTNCQFAVFLMLLLHILLMVCFETFFLPPYCKRTVKTAEGKRIYLKGRNFCGANFSGINFRDFGHNSRKKVRRNLQNIKQSRKIVPQNLIKFQFRKQTSLINKKNQQNRLLLIHKLTIRRQ